LDNSPDLEGGNGVAQEGGGQDDGAAELLPHRRRQRLPLAHLRCDSPRVYDLGSGVEHPTGQRVRVTMQKGIMQQQQQT
jgi:hypothetical protein